MTDIADNTDEHRPLAKTIAAALRANILPAIALQSAALAILLTYFYVPPVTHLFDGLADLKQRFGYGYSIVATSLAAGVLPLLLMHWQRGRTRSVTAGDWAFGICLWGLKGVEIDLFYRLQARAFSEAVDLPTVVTKTLIDQIAYVPFWGMTSCLVAYAWHEGGWTAATLRNIASIRWLRETWLPAMVANWLVWIPAVVMIYCLPLPLQLPFQNIVLCFWVLILTFLTQHQAK
jgi:hypothetical protein